MATADVQQKGVADLLSRVEPDEAKDATVDVQADLTFAELDMTDAKHWLEKNKLKYDPGMAYHWLNSDPRFLPKRLYIGWKLVEPAIRRGDLLLAFRPQAINKRDKARIAKLSRDREKGPMRTYEREVSGEVASGNFETFDGSKGHRDGL